MQIFKSLGFWGFGVYDVNNESDQSNENIKKINIKYIQKVWSYLQQAY